MGLNYKSSISTMEVFHLIIQTSVTSFLVFIPVTLIFFLFINFFSFQKYSWYNVCILHALAQQSIMVLQCRASPHNFLSSPPSAPQWFPPKWQRHHAEFLFSFSSSLLTIGQAGYRLIFHCSRLLAIDYLPSLSTWKFFKYPHTV